jgi:hypothetical protein
LVCWCIQELLFCFPLSDFFQHTFSTTSLALNIAELSYGYIGFNFILTAIAIGGFFIVPSKYSFLWVILLTPIISFIITATSAFFKSCEPFHLLPGFQYCGGNVSLYPEIQGKKPLQPGTGGCAAFFA